MVVLYFLRKPKQKIVLNQYHTIRPDFPLIGKVLAIGIPAGVENGMFQFGKLAIQSTVSTLGTQAIAAQAMTVIFENVNGIAAIAVGIGLMTVAGQAFGAGRKEEAKYYIIKLTGYAETVLIISCAVTFLISRPIMASCLAWRLRSMELCYQMLIAITIAKPILWALSFIPPYGLRAAGDVKFSMTQLTLHDVVLQGGTGGLSDPFSGIWTDRSVDRNVYRLDDPWNYLIQYDLKIENGLLIR